MKIQGYDLSHHQKKGALTEVPKQDFVVIKATEGIGYSDVLFDSHVKDAVKMGYSTIGAYHFVRADIKSNTPEGEARSFARKISDTFEKLHFLAIDVEGTSLSVTNITEYVKRLITELRLSTKLPILIYVQGSSLNKFTYICDEISGVAMWLADWTNVTIEASAKRWGFEPRFIALHQTGSINSAGTEIDYNYGNDAFLSYGAEINGDVFDDINILLSDILNSIYSAKELLSNLRDKVL